MKSILYVILHTQHHPQRFKWVTQTWGKDIDYIFISDHEDLQKNIIKVSDTSDYSSCEEKQINSINILSSKQLDYDFYFFCSNDNFINTKKMDQFIQNCDVECVWGELDNCLPHDKTFYFLLGGSGILISKEIMQKINGTMKWANGQHPSSFPSDVSICINFKNKNIEMRNSELFHCQAFESWFQNNYAISEIDYKLIKNHITFHYVNNFELMNLYYTKCND